MKTERHSQSLCHKRERGGKWHHVEVLRGMARDGRQQGVMVSLEGGGDSCQWGLSWAWPDMVVENSRKDDRGNICSQHEHKHLHSIKTIVKGVHRH